MRCFTVAIVLMVAIALIAAWIIEPHYFSTTTETPRQILFEGAYNHLNIAKGDYLEVLVIETNQNTYVFKGNIIVAKTIPLNKSGIVVYKPNRNNHLIFIENQ